MNKLKSILHKTNISKRVFAILLVILIINISLVIFSIWNNLNIFQLDMIGHFASGTFFKSIGMHQFNDIWFLGYVNNLFYPPLEDFLFTIISYITQDGLIAFKVLISLVLSGYLFSIILLSKKFKFGWIKNTFLFSSLILLNLHKTTTLHQGLSYFDMLFTGLTSQFLGAMFLLLLIYVLLGKNKYRYLRVFILGVASIMSHLVIAPIAALLVALFAIFEKDIKLIFVGIGVLLSSSFFIIPFAVSSNFMTSANILTNIPIFTSILTAISLGLAIRSKNKKHIAIAISATILITLNIVNYLGYQLNLNFMPAFHYYRFNSTTILLGIIAILGSADILRQKKQKIFKQLSIIISIAVSITAITIASYTGIFGIKKYHEQINNNDTKIKNSSILNKIDDGKRIFTISPYRAIDFNLDSYLAGLGYDLHFVKGLFWESNLSNTLISSYIAMTLDKSNIVTNYVESDIQGCGFIKELRDNAISDLSIGRFAISPIDKITYLDQEKIQCYNDIIQNGTNGFNWTKKGEFNANKIDYSLFKISAKSGYYNDMVLAYQDVDIKLLNINEIFFYGNIFADAFSNDNTTGSKLLYSLEPIQNQTDHKSFTQKHNSKQNNYNNTIIGNFTKTKNGEYNIYIESEKDLWFTISLNYFPGFELYTESGKKLPIFRGNHYMISKGHGTMILKYTKPRYFKYLYIISILSFVISIILLSKTKYFQKRLKIMP